MTIEDLRLALGSWLFVLGYWLFPALAGLALGS
jgi:hypothetical protein